MRRLASMATASTAAAGSQFVQKSKSGAVVTVLSAIVAAWLMTHEIKGFMRPELQQVIGVDQTRHDLLRLTFNVSFPYTPCAALHVDTADQSGEGSSDSAADVGSDGRNSNNSPSPRDLLRAQHSLRDGARRTAVPHQGGGAASAAGGELHKFRLDSNGADLPGHPEFVPPSPVHVSLGGFSFDQQPAMEGVLDAAFDNREGCRLEGWLAAQRVAGTLLFRPHLEDYLATRAAKSQLAGQMADQLQRAAAEGRGAAFLPHVLRIDPDFSKLNVMHIVHELSFESGREGGSGGGSGSGDHQHQYDGHGGHRHHHPRRPRRSARSRAVAAARSGALGKDVQEALPRDPLSGVLRGSPRRTGSWNYFAKVVPTTLDASVVGGRASREADAKIKAAEGGYFPSPPSSPSASSDAAFPIHAVHTYQYSITEKFTALDPKSPAIPTVSISYDMSPLTLSLSRPQTPLPHALVRLVAVGGGVKALASFLGALVHALAGRRRAGGTGSGGRRGSGSGGE